MKLKLNFAAVVKYVGLTDRQQAYMKLTPTKQSEKHTILADEAWGAPGISPLEMSHDLTGPS